MIITFFPSFVFTTAGLRDLPHGSQDLFSVLGASRRATLRRLALPAAVPNMAIALRLAAAHAILAAMIAEFLMGTTGLGYLFAVTKQEFLDRTGLRDQRRRNRDLRRRLPRNVASRTPNSCALHLTGLQHP